jgi:hypothetical protein
MKEFVELAANGVNHSLLTMTGIRAADASGKVDVAVAVDVFQPGAFGFRDVDRRAVRKAAGHGLGAALGESLRLRTGDGRADSNGTHVIFSREFPESTGGVMRA